MILLLVHAAATLAMTGLIWFVQVVHYPLFPFAAASDFGDFAAEHQRRTSWVVLPPMAVELATAALLVAQSGAAFRPLALIGVALLGIIWLSTALVQVPLHRRLARGFEDGAARRLVTTNWLRTAAWSARSLIALRLLAT